MKRLIDIIVGSLFLVLLSPVLSIVAIGVWLDVGSPVLFRQVRPGRKGKPFTLVKFRTMRPAAPVKTFPLGDEQRVTRFGRWLRSTSLDELPELWNVLRGDMSLVGPRPLLMQYLPRYTPAQIRRHDVRPGLTGWAQINGRNALDWEEKFRLDVWYVDNRSLLLDLQILLRTAASVVSRRGISHGESATMPEFMGTRDVGSSRTNQELE